MDCEIALQNPNQYPEASARRLRPWLARLLPALVPKGGSFGVRFVSDRKMRRTNRFYRSLDKTTDVLSFPGEEGGPGDGGEELRHVGDVLISVPMARRQATAAGHGVERELRVLILHGLLHCLGYDHETDQGEMERLERRLRSTWIPRSDFAGEGA
jgi:probable rRNA maturation factor